MYLLQKETVTETATDLPAMLFPMTLHDGPVYLVHKIWWRQLSRASMQTVTSLVIHILRTEQSNGETSSKLKDMTKITKRCRVIEY